MTTDPFDDLEHRLRARVRELPAPARAGSRRRRRLPRTPLLAVLLVGLGAGGVAVAATSLGGGTEQEQGWKIARQAELAVASEPICARLSPTSDPALVTYSDATPLPAVRRALPWLSSPATGREAAMARFLLKGWTPDAPVVRGTEHVIDAGRDRSLFVYLQEGQGASWGVARNPAACAARREERAREFAGDRPVVLAAALQRLRGRADVAVGSQVLSVSLTRGDCRLDGPRCGGGGTAMVYWPDAAYPHREVTPGLLLSGGGTYLGLGSPRAHHLSVQGRYPERLRGVPRTIRLRRGFWVLDLPRKSGAVRVVEHAADGTVLRMVAVRGTL